MDTGFGQNLEGFLIKGNLSLSPSTVPELYGDGSIEGSGTLYIDYITEYNQSNGVEIQGVKFKEQQIIVPYTAPSNNISSGAIVVEGGISIKDTSVSLSLTSGGALTVAGGVSIKKNVNIGGILNVNNNKIQNVAWPIYGGDATNKDYVDSVSTRIWGNFTRGQVIIGDSEGDSIRGFESFTFTEDNLRLEVPFVIANTTNVNSSGQYGALIVEGGVSIAKDVYLSGLLDLGGNVITNVANPIEPSDVATKEYVDVTKIIANFTTGQVIIGSGEGDAIRGYDNLLYDGSTFSILGTNNIIGSIGGAFVCYGGVSISKDVFIGGKIFMDGYSIKNVGEPLEDNDVATKFYVDSKTYGNVLGSFGVHEIVVGSTEENNLTSYPSFSFDGEYLNLGTVASFVIQNTETGYSLTDGTTLKTYGGASVYKNLYVGGILDVNNNNIISVAEPINDSDAATKFYVDSKTYGNVLGNFGVNQVAVGTTDESVLTSYSSFSFDGEYLNLNTSASFLIENTQTGYSLTDATTLKTYGGASIYKNLYVGGVIDVNNNNINNVAEPVNDSDAATKFYVDSKTYGNVLGSLGANQIVIGTTDENVIKSYNSFSFDGEYLNLGTSASFIIQNTQTGYKLTDATSLTIYGGASVYKNLYVGGTLDVNYNNITSVAEPINPSDAATKQYVDDRKLQGNFTTGQVIIADSNGDAIRGFDSFTYNSTTNTLILTGDFDIQNDTNAVGLGSGGSFNTLGGGSFGKDVYIGGQLDVNVNRITSVATPEDDLDAVNKAYVDSLIDLISDTITGDTYVLDNNTSIPTDIAAFYYPSSVKSFITHIYLRRNTDCSLYILSGINTGDGWKMTSRFIGQPLGVRFYIRNDNGKGIIQYTNDNISGISSIIAKNLSRIDAEGNTEQLNLVLSGNISSWQEIPELSFSNANYHYVRIETHIYSETDGKCGLAIINCLRKDNEWILNTVLIGDLEGIKFNIISDGVSGILSYTNSNASDDYTLRIKKSSLLTEVESLTLDANTIEFTLVNTNDLSYADSDKIFELLIYAEEPITNKYALYEIVGMTCKGIWRINSRFIGDNLGVVFNMETDNGIGKLEYKSSNSNDVFIKYSKVSSSIFQPLQVNQGGTGNDYLLPYAVLRGNGSDPILSSNDFIYKDYKLILGTQSNLLLTNTSPSVNLTTGGAITSYGGVNILNNVRIGNELDMTLNNIKNVKDPVEYYDAVNKLYVDQKISEIDITGTVNDDRIEYTMTLNNNVTEAEDIPNFEFGDTVRSFISNVYVEANGVCGLYSIHGFKANEYWSISNIFTGKPTGVKFNIREEDGRAIVQYTNSNVAGVTYVKFRTISQLDDVGTSQQINFALDGNVTEPTDIPILSFNNDTVDAVKLIVYISSEIDDKYGMYLSNCVLKGGEWFMNTQLIGTVSGIKLSIKTENGKGTIQYTNTNLANDYNIRTKVIKIDDLQQELVLVKNTNVPTLIDTNNLTFPDRDTYFQISVYVTVPELNKFALHEIRGVVCNGVWSLNTRYIGDYTGIKFYIDSSSVIGYAKLMYTNQNDNDAIIKFIKNAPLASLKPLDVNKGGTGSSFFRPNAVLRGNGTNPIVATGDFIYEDYKLILGDVSSIILQNTESPVNLTTGGTLISYGGIAVGKELLVGEKIKIKDVDITPNDEDIVSEREFNANNNQSVPDDVVGFVFPSKSKSFTGIACVTVITSMETHDCLFELRGLKKSSGWIIDSKFIGDSLGIEFSISNIGQVKYTSTNIANWIETKIKFRALTTTM